MNNTDKQQRQRYTRRHHNSPNYARWYEIVNWASWIAIAAGFILFIVGLGLLGSPNDRVSGTDATIVWAVGLGVSFISVILCFILIWIDGDYESQQQAQMMHNVANVTPDQWKNLGNTMAQMAAAYQQAKPQATNNNASNKNNK